jgi:basic membrane protein A and related proteins
VAGPQFGDLNMLFASLWHQRRIRATTVLSGALGLVATALVSFVHAQETKIPLKIGFVYVSPISDAGWTHQHNQARLEMEKNLSGKVTTSFVENVAEGPDAERVIRDMVAQGHRLIFTTSFGYMNPTEKIAKQFPAVVFMHATGYKTAANLGNYNARFYEGRYLNGVLAGKMSKSGIAGYVAAFPIPEVLQGINAFTRGMQSVNPKADVKVIWVNSWFDPGREREAALTLVSQGADVLTHHTDSTAVVQAAESKNVYAFGYHSDMSKYGPRAHLSSTTHHWGAYYTKVANDVINNQWKSDSIWGGSKDGFIKMGPINANVPASIKAQLLEAESLIKSGQLQVFSAPVIDQSGKERNSNGKTLSDEELNKMDYFVRGVTSKLPARK